MEILARLTRVEVEITDGVLKNWASEMATLPYIRSVQGKRGSIKRFLRNGKLPPMVSTTCVKCSKTFEYFKGMLGSSEVRCAFLRPKAECNATAWTIRSLGFLGDMRESRSMIA